MGVEIIDTTLRDGEQKAGIAFSIEDKIQISKYLNSMNIYQIEAGIPAMGGDEKESIKEIVALGLNSKISAWNRMSIKDIDQSMECGVDNIHISVPASNLQIESKLSKNKIWVIDNIIKCIDYATNEGYEVTVGLEDASRADINFLKELCKIGLSKGVSAVRYADTVGIMYPRKIYNEILKIRETVPIEIEIHTHNDLGMAVANSIAAVEGGAKFVDCTISGIGERAGNCNYNEFIKGLYETTGEKLFPKNIDDINKCEQYIKNIVAYGKRYFT